MTTLACLEEALHHDIKPACGCTEPAAIALAACHATRLAGGEIERLEVQVSTNLFKNAVEVGIPGTHGARGIELAAALGCVLSDGPTDLTILNAIDEARLAKAQSLVQDGRIVLRLDQSRQGLHLDCTARSRSGQGRAVISGSHEHLARLERNGTVVHEAPEPDPKRSSKVLEARQALANERVAALLEALPALPAATRTFLLEGIDMNRKVAEAGLHNGGSLKVGGAYRTLIQKGWLANDVITRAKMLTSAAVDARMSGCELPVMTSGGSGNQGLTITLPLSVLATVRSLPEARLTEALALAHAITSILKHHTGTLSAMCGCVVCAGTGLTAGVTYLLGGGLEAITAAVNTMTGGITGIICDGAKVGCAIKLITAVDAAFQAAFLALHGICLPSTNGVVGATVEESLRNIGLVAAPGMVGTDAQILAIMTSKPM
ncbi:MAG: Inner membrane protein [Candidatus Ozemobacter sibiricus]|uniref:UPF0597 protein OZSIB_2394 n=1 Tax=Candidatus Ozemobacter sibiricus TaxID=2268124 RepID=A0A367ZT42_9BACT|nr:MAG: Inner membrane protein [Candidatus Ozemobacter sibiricus]